MCVCKCIRTENATQVSLVLLLGDSDRLLLECVLLRECVLSENATQVSLALARRLLDGVGKGWAKRVFYSVYTYS